jgi:hypothetical protein
MADPLGVLAEVRQRPPLKLKTSMAGPLGCWWQVWQWPPPKLETSMSGLLGVLAAGPAAATTEVEDVDGGPPGGAGARDSGAHTTNAKKHRRRALGRCWS